MIDRDDCQDLFDAPASATAAPAVAVHVDTPPASLGQRLRSARDARGLGIADCARRLHLPVKVLQRLEADDYGSPEHFVFLRGALQGYAKFLELPVGACDPALRSAAPAAQPQLVSVAHTSTTRWLLQRYGTAATYIVLTAFIAVPLVLLGLRGGLDRPAPRLVSLDQASSPAAPHERANAAAKPAAAPADSPDSAPFRASLTPFAAMGLRDVDADNANDSAPASAATPAQAVSGQHVLAVTASADCWYAITGADGQKLDSGMLHAGDVRSWHSAGALHATFGNADGVAVTEDGKPVDLAPFRHANVARLDAFGPAAGGTEND